MRDGLLDEHVLSGLERRHRQLEVGVVAGDDVDDVDVVVRQHVVRVGRRRRNAVFVRGLVGERAVDVADGDQLAAPIALPAGQVSHVRPPARADHSDS